MKPNPHVVMGPVEVRVEVARYFLLHPFFGVPEILPAKIAVLMEEDAINSN